MGKSFFSNTLSNRAQRGRRQKKKDGAPQASPNAPEPSAMTNTKGMMQDAPEAAQDAPEAIPEIYDDVTVCRLLRVRRNVLAAARTKRTRGTDWDAIDLHVGMTRDWIVRWACLRGFVPRFDGAKPIAAGDGIVSCILVQTWPNPSRATVEIVATGAREVATVRDMRFYPLRLREAFDCVRAMHNRLEWTGKPNETVW